MRTGASRPTRGRRGSTVMGPSFALCGGVLVQCGVGGALYTGETRTKESGLDGGARAVLLCLPSRQVPVRWRARQRVRHYTTNGSRTSLRAAAGLRKRRGYGLPPHLHTSCDPCRSATHGGVDLGRTSKDMDAAELLEIGLFLLNRSTRCSGAVTALRRARGKVQTAVRKRRYSR